MASPWFDIRDFDARHLARDGSADWSSVFERAIDFLNNLSLRETAFATEMNPGGSAGTLYLPTGIYTLSRPLLIARPGASAYEPCSFSIVGHASAQARGPEARIQLSGAARRGWPAVIIQSGATVHLRNLVIQGSPLAALQGIGQELMPYAGICIDPFGAILARDGYPGMEDRYLLDGPPSRDILVEGCQVRDFSVGIWVAPSPSSGPRRPAAASLNVRTSQIEARQSCIAIGRERTVLLHSITLSQAQVGINCVDHGGPGPCPSIFGGTATQLTHLFKTQATGTSALISGLDTHQVNDLGQLGDPFSGLLDTCRFDSCRFSLGTSHEYLSFPPQPPAHLVNFAQTTFHGCHFQPDLFTQEDLAPPLHIVNEGWLSFSSCEMAAPFWISGKTAQVSYQDCLTADQTSGGRVSFSTLQNAPWLRAPTQGRALYGVARAVQQAPFVGPQAPRWAPPLSQVFLGRHDARSLSFLPGGRVSFEVPAGILQRGDLVITSTPVPGVLLYPADRDAAPLLVGRVLSISASGATSERAVLGHVPSQLQGGLETLGELIPLWLAYHPRLHPTTQAFLSSDPRLIDVVQIIPLIPLASAWAPGDHISGDGLPAGAYVTQVLPGSSQLRLSRGVLARHGREISLYDAEVRTLKTSLL